MQTQNMGSDNVNNGLPDRHSNRKAFSGPLNKRGSRKSARFNIPEDSSSCNSSVGGNMKSRNDYVEITLDVDENSVAVHSKKTLVLQSASEIITQVSEELKRLTLFSRRLVSRFDRTNSASTHAFKRVEFCL